MTLHAGHPHVHRWREIGHGYKQRWNRHFNGDDEEEGDDEEAGAYPRPKPHGCNVQVVRSVSDWSHGVLTEKSIQTACKFLWLTLDN
jgi:phospholipase D1/2